MTGKGGKGGGKSQEWPKLPKGGGEAAQILAELKAQRLKLDLLAKQRQGGGATNGGGNKGQVNSANPRSAGWECSCGFHNFGFRLSCRDCGKGKGQKPPSERVSRDAERVVPGKGAGAGGGQVPTPASPQEEGRVEDLATRVSMAKHMLSAARAAPECKEQKTLVGFWEQTIRDLKEEERRSLPIPHQLKSALDRLEGKKRAREAFEKAEADLEAKLEAARRETKDALAAEEAEKKELERLQSQAAAANSQPDVLMGGPSAKEEELDKKVEYLSSILADVLAALPSTSEDLKTKLQGVLTPNPAITPPPPGGTQAPNPPALPEGTNPPKPFGKVVGGEGEEEKGVVKRVAPY